MIKLHPRLKDPKWQVFAEWNNNWQRFEDFLKRNASRRKSCNCSRSDPHSADARFAAHYSRVDRDSI